MKHRRFSIILGLALLCIAISCQMQQGIDQLLVEEGDAEGVSRSIAEDNDRRRVCGYPPIYMTLRCIGRTEGMLLQYRQWSDLNTGAAVTYAALALF